MVDAVLLALVAGCAAVAGSDDWRAREAASAGLSAVAMDWQLVALESSPDPEIARRAGVVLRERRDARLVLAIETVRRAIADEGLPAWPWIDSIPHDTVERFAVVSPYLERAKDCGFTSSGPDFAAYREASRMWLTDLLWSEDGRNVEGVAKLARQMVQGDREQCKKCGYKWVGAGRP